MIDAINISNFNLTDDQLEENILFWICAAGKNGVTAAKCLNNLLLSFDSDLWTFSPLQKILTISQANLKYRMQQAGIGCYEAKSNTFIELAVKVQCSTTFNLRTCTIDDLEKIKGIGPKTSRAFILHTRPNQRVAAVDTHLLKFLKDNGVQDVPKSTPPKGKTYRRLEEAFLTLCDQAGRIPVEYDLEIWNHYRLKKGPMYVNG